MVRSIMALLRKWHWNLTNTAIEHFSCRFLPLIYLFPEGWNIWQGWRGMRILVSFHHANACCSDGRWFSARVGVIMVTQYLSHIWGGWTCEGLWEHKQVHNLEDQIAIHLNVGIIKLQTQVYKTPGSPISLSWSATSASCVSLYITYSLAVAPHTTFCQGLCSERVYGCRNPVSFQYFASEMPVWRLSAISTSNQIQSGHVQEIVGQTAAASFYVKVPSGLEKVCTRLAQGILVHILGTKHWTSGLLNESQVVCEAVYGPQFNLPFFL